MITDFSNLGIHSKVVKAMNDMGWTEPTPIQVEAIPCGLTGSDMLAQAQTGTGKTGTYGSIILGRIQSGQKLPGALVLVPTRELALQVVEEIDKLSKYTGHRCIPIYGGANMTKQAHAIESGSDILIATPGRLKDFLQTYNDLLSKTAIVILDEADRMLDMGFARDLDYILSRVPKKRQTMLFSATMSSDIKSLALRQMVKPKEILVSKDEPVLDLITQYYMYVEKPDKIETLRYVLGKDRMKTIVFCHTKHRVDQVVRKLKNDFSIDGIHGGHAQNRRERTIKAFKDDDIEILIASDIAARGLDIENVMRVINMDMPLEPETYVHRIGRTGRAGKNGISVSFVMPEEKSILRDIEKLTDIPITRIDPPTGKDIATVSKVIAQSERPRNVEIHPPVQSKKNCVPVDRKSMATMEINLGAADRYGKALISRFIHDNTDIPNKSVGIIDPGEKTSLVDIENTYVKQVIADLSICTVNGKSVRISVKTPAKDSAPNNRTGRNENRRPRNSTPRSSGSDRRPIGNRSNGRRDDSQSRPRTQSVRRRTRPADKSNDDRNGFHHRDKTI